MATWTPNPIYGTPNGGDFTDDLGRVWPDPDGHLNTPTAAAPPGAAGGPGVLANNPLAMPAGAPAPPPLANNPLAMPAANPDEPPDPAKIISVGKVSPPSKQELGAAMAPTPAHDTREAAHDMPPDPDHIKAASPFVAVSESKNSRTGLSDADRAAAQGDVSAMSEAELRANQSGFKVDQARADLMQRRADADVQAALQGQINTGRKLDEQERIAKDVEQRLNSDKMGGSAWTPDRTQIFEGGRGAAFGISAVIAALAGGWMMGRSGSQQNAFLPSIFRMIDDNVSDQVRKNTAMFQHLKELKGDTGAAIAALKQQQIGYAQQKLQGIAAQQDSDIVKQQAQATYDKLDAEREKHKADEHRKLMQAVTIEHSTHMVKNPAAAPPRALSRALQIRYANNNMLAAKWQSARRVLKSAEQSGAAAAYLGTVATHGVSWVQEHLNGLPPEQQQLANAITELHAINHLENQITGIEADEKGELGKVGVPTKLKDLSTTFQHFDELTQRHLDENKQLLQGAGNEDPEGETDEPVGSY